MGGERDVTGPVRSILRRPWRLVLLSILLPLLVLSLVDLRPAVAPGEARVENVQQGVGGLRVGAGKARVELPSDSLLAGYRPFGRRAGGAPGPTYVRSLVLEAEGIRTGIILVELMTLPASLADRIAERARSEGIDCSLRIATHTHAGPGGYDRALLPQLVGVGRFEPAVEEALLTAVSASLAAARAELGPAEHRFEERQVNLARNRDRRGEPVDDRLGRLDFVRPDGSRVATVVRLAAHPTLAPLEGGLSGDWPGAAMELLEEGGGVALVLQGAVGDARARKNSPEGFAERVVEESGDLLEPSRQGTQEAPAFAGDRSIARVVGAGTIGVDEVPAFAGTNKVGNEESMAPASVLACAEGVIGLPLPDPRAMVPRPLSRLITNAMLPFAPATARIAALRIGEHVFLGIPAEPTAPVGALLEERAGPGARVVSVAQDYVGYAVLDADMDQRVFSARVAWFGAALTPALVRGAGAVADAVRAPAAPDGEAAIAP